MQNLLVKSSCVFVSKTGQILWTCKLSTKTEAKWIKESVSHALRLKKTKNSCKDSNLLTCGNVFSLLTGAERKYNYKPSAVADCYLIFHPSRFLNWITEKFTEDILVQYLFQLGALCGKSTPFGGTVKEFFQTKYSLKKKKEKKIVQINCALVMKNEGQNKSGYTWHTFNTPAILRSSDVRFKLDGRFMLTDNT